MLQPESEIKGFRLQSSHSRFFVPDFSPMDRVTLEKKSPQWIFVAESPHISEVEPERLAERRPLCGAAGRQWWSLLHEILEDTPNSDVSLEHLLGFCANHHLVVINAVQFPIDPKITRLYPQADPVKTVGFSKMAGPTSYKKLKDSPAVQEAIGALRDRLEHPWIRHLPVYPLGNDAEWFVLRALASEEDRRIRVKDKIPHPSAWWRRGGLFGRIAREKLSKILLG